MIEITIGQELMDLNNYVNAERSNRFKASKIKKEQTEIVAASIRKAMVAGISVSEKDFPLDFEFHWYMKNKRKDKDNIVFAKKFLFDGMISSGFIENDGWKEVGSFKDTVLVDKDNPRVEMKIKTSGENK